VHKLVALGLASGSFALLTTQSFATPVVAPKLRLVKLAPLTLRGSSFRGGERVRITLTFRRVRAIRTVHADRSGGFTFRYTTLLALEPCHGSIVVIAVGASGRTATWKRPCRPADSR
jgi:hypothetical protein